LVVIGLTSFAQWSNALGAIRQQVAVFVDPSCPAKTGARDQSGSG
jgi:hypothetical protein